MTKMETYTLKEGNGWLWGIDNELDQAGKTISIYDGDILYFTTPLDKAFPWNEEMGGPGIILERPFIRSLRVETDGGALQFHYR